MKNASVLAAAAALCVGLQGCGSWSPFGRSAAGEANRVPAGATEYVCDEGKRLFVRFLDDARSAWVILPEREVRLDRPGSAERYSNGSTTLSLQADSARLEVEGAASFANCKRKST